MQRPGEAPQLSVVAPAHDEADNLDRLIAEVRAALDTVIPWELIVVDDGSTDETHDVLASIARADPRVRPVRLETRSGQTAALMAGIGAAAAPLVATLDADLQCSPRDLPALLALLDDADLACGIRTRRRDPWRRRAVSGVSNVIRRCLVAPRLRDLACPLRVFRIEALARLDARGALFDGAHRWLPALFVLAGLRVVQHPIVHHQRHAGVSKYTATGRAVPVARELLRVLAIAQRLRRGHQPLEPAAWPMPTLGLGRPGSSRDSRAS
jgi:dolichol-phosphate mannosyltransferase